ncbi:MAG TPA: transglycosylase domain-containing protein [Rubrobacteraceae bacterium]|nr:transglycosylase domain-containing protein [Rubrobacteraceae bacterium]
MARTYQRKGQGTRVKAPQRSGRERLPASTKRRFPYGDLKKRILRAAGIFFLCVLVAALGLAAGGYLGLVRSVDKLGKSQSLETHPTYIYSAPLGGNDDSRRVIATIFQGENRKAAAKEEMPLHLLNALVAKEDERFMAHGGVDLWGIMRALYVDIRAGEAVEGASTITQQYVRNAYLSHDRTIIRKIKEALIAIEIERRIDDKDQIIANYLNTVYYGNSAYGVEAASETYFNKSVEDLTVAESATLVGLLWSPSTLGVDREAARYQRDLVLEKMFDAGYITNEDYTDAREHPMPKRWPISPMVESGLTGPSLTRDFAELVQGELVSRYGANTVLQGNLSVYTTLDLEAQVKAREILYEPAGYLPNRNDPQAALVSVEPGTGRIRAMVGNRDQRSEFNLVTQGRRQPGSAFKPFALIAALEQGIDPDTTFVSRKKEYLVDVGTDRPERWKVRNYDGIERGRITLKEALWWSDNTVFTDLVMNADGKGLEGGAAAIVDVAKRCGITADFGARPHPSVVLGTQEVSPLDLTMAYATIANGGRRVEPATISKVVSDEGQENEKVLYQAPSQPDGEQVIDPEIAHEATEIMIGDVTEGIASDADLGERPVAGKTGTSENFFDAWFVGYTPQLLTGLWMGYAEGGQTLEYELEYARELNGLSGGITPAMIWKTYMEQVLEGEPIEKFEGVEMPANDERPIPPDNGSPNVRDQVGAERFRGASDVNPYRDVPSNVNASSVGPSSAGPSSVGPTSASPTRSSASPAPRAASVRPRR